MRAVQIDTRRTHPEPSRPASRGYDDMRAGRRPPRPARMQV